MARSPASKAQPRGFEAWNPKQEALLYAAGSDSTHILAYGGSRSGKTFAFVSAIVARGLKAPGSSHVIFRYRFNHLKHSVIGQTLPQVFSKVYPQLGTPKVHKSDWLLELPGGSVILFGGLDDAERTEKILGQEHATIYINEASQVSYDARNKAVTRLAQVVKCRDGSLLVPKAYYDANPPTKDHWTYRLFVEKVEPITRSKLRTPNDFAAVQLNPGHNLANLPESYIRTLQDLPEKARKRFLDGEFLTSIDGALWTWDMIERNRVRSAELPQMQRIVVAVDPSGARGPEDSRSDEIGIVVVGLGQDGLAYVLEDLSGRYSPKAWGRTAVSAFKRWKADRVVGEVNYGGGMVEFVLRTVDANVPYKEVHATRGKAVRAEPISALYETDRVKHLVAEDGTGFVELEEQLTNFSQAGYQGSRSPDRADAAIWGLSELMLGGSTYSLKNVL